MTAFDSRINDYDSVITMLRYPEKISDGARLYYLAAATRRTVFENNNNTNYAFNVSGNFRLIHKKEIAERIVAYENDIDNYWGVYEYGHLKPKPCMTRNPGFLMRLFSTT